MNTASLPLVDLQAMTRDELAAVIANLGEKTYRVQQVLAWLHQRRVRDVAAMSDVPAALRATLTQQYPISPVKLAASTSAADGTIKALLELSDGHRIEAVSMPYESRHTLCLSTQVGCALGCAFCSTGAHGFRRDMTASEILSQLKIVWEFCQPEHRPNIVLMGMGEPLRNLNHVLRALTIMTAPWGMDVSKRKITVSTAGDVPGIAALGRSGLGVMLSISLNATDNGTRSRIMPINQRYPIEAVLDACRSFPVPPGRRITIEYVLIAGINDSDADAHRLQRLLRGIPCKINLIPLNPAEGFAGKAPSAERILRFQQVLIDGHYSAFIRDSKGAQITAACGQLWEGGSHG